MSSLGDGDIATYLARLGEAEEIIEAVKNVVDTMWFESNDGDVIHVDHIYHALGIDQLADQLATAPKNARPLVDPWATTPLTDDDVILHEGEAAA